MITYIQAIVLGALQGATELFPVSSLGHSVIAPAVLGWHIDQAAPFFVNFLVATHLATSLVLLAFFWKDWLKIIAGILRSLATRRIDPGDVYARLGWLIIAATIPAGILGLLLQHKIEALFAAPMLIAFMLILNGFMLYIAEFLTNRQTGQVHSDETISKLSWSKAIKIGFAQALALIPGFSRTGATLGGGILAGLDHANAARFSFLLATPIILAAAVLKLPTFIKTGGTHSLGITLAGAVSAAIFAFMSVKYLTAYFEHKTLKPFAGYCIIAGIAAVVILYLQ